MANPNEELPDAPAQAQDELTEQLDINTLINTTAVVQQIATISLTATQQVIRDQRAELFHNLNHQNTDHEKL